MTTFLETFSLWTNSKYKHGKPARPEWDRNVREILTFREDGDREDKDVNFYS